MSNVVKGGFAALSMAVGVGVIVAIWCTALDVPLRAWLAGAAALGLLTGFTTGLSSHAGSGIEFVKFLGAGILVPLVGGASALIARPQQVTEKSTYSGTQLVEKVTTTVTSSDAAIHPLTILGSFFLVFAAIAILGILGGVLARSAGLPEIKLKP